MSSILDATRNVTTQFSILSSTVCPFPIPLPVYFRFHIRFHIRSNFGPHIPLCLWLNGSGALWGLNHFVKLPLKVGSTSGPLPVHVRFITLNFLSDLLGSMNSILVTCKYHTHLIPGVFELLNDIERLDILRLMTFPWQFRYIQKLCMEELYIKWCDFILTGINGYLKIPNKISDIFGSFQT